MTGKVQTIHNTTPIEPEVYREMGLSDEEYKSVVDVLGRHPTYTEVGMYSVMWSEHCGYKYSRPVLTLFKKYKEAIEGEGLENAGIIDIGDGYGICMKMESHNHPSAVEPFQGAATGVGGILRDIFTMGARPIASLNSLRFGSLDDARNRYLFEHVVGGIAFYGNCVGVPTVAGEIYFEDCYTGNCLVNAMSVGLLKHDDVAYACAHGPGNSVLIVGSRTGRDGIHGATFASVELGPDSESKRPNVQMGDPFTEKLLIEATLEGLKTGHIVGIQDMGAAGITCSTCETSAKAGTGMKVDVRKVPLREEGMSSYEIMLSESQERMLAIVTKGNEEEVASVFRKWGLMAVHVGEVTDDELVRIYDGEDLVAQVPAKSLADDAPTYHLDTERPEYLDRLHNEDISHLPEPDDYNEALHKILASPSIAGKGWVYEQYDHMVQTNTVVMPGSDAAVIRIRNTKKAIALTSDCNSRYCYLDPFTGAQIAVCESARNLACTGAKPMGVTDCLNFGNPEKPEAFWQFKTAVEGLAEACEFFEAPVVSGNVSFYNETPETAIYPTPVIGMVGLIEDIDKICTTSFKEEGDIICLISGVRYDEKVSEYDVCELESLGGSEYLKVVHDRVAGKPPVCDMTREKRVQNAVISAIEQGLVLSAHDCAEGGIAVALAECCMAGSIGADVSLSANCAPSAALFAETQGRILLTCKAKDLGKVRDAVDDNYCECTILGKVAKDKLTISINDEKIIEQKVKALAETYHSSIPEKMKD